MMRGRDMRRPSSRLRVYLRNALPFALVAPVVSLGYLVPVPGAVVPNVEVWTSQAAKCTASFGIGWCDASHLDAIATTPGGVVAGTVTAVAIAVLAWRSFAKHKLI